MGVKVGQAIAIVATNDAVDLSAVASFTAADFDDAPAAAVVAPVAAAVNAASSQASETTSSVRATTSAAAAAAGGAGGAVNASPFVRAKLRAV